MISQFIWKRCVNCNERFRKFKKPRQNGGGRPSGIRGYNCKTCCTKCSKEWERK